MVTYTARNTNTRQQTTFVPKDDFHPHNGSHAKDPNVVGSFSNE
jgi:hypothetical protein